MIKGISTSKYHLAKPPRHDIGICPQVGPEVMRVVHDSIHAKDRKKEEAASHKVECAIRSSGLSTTKGSGRGSTDSPTKRSSYFFVPPTKVGAQPSIMSMIEKRERAEANRVMGKCLF
jgi:hypothetical protein